VFDALSIVKRVHLQFYLNCVYVWRFSTAAFNSHLSRYGVVTTTTRLRIDSRSTSNFRRRVNKSQWRTHQSGDWQSLL